MKILNKLCALARFFVVLCVLIEIQSTPSDLNCSESYDPFTYEKQANPLKLNRDFSYTPRNIKSNINRHINDSDIVVNFSEDTSDLNNEFKNATYYMKEFVNNKTDEEFFRLTNDNLNQTQLTNFTNYFHILNDSSPDKLSLVHAKGNSKTTSDFYHDRGLLTNVSLRTYDHDVVSIDADNARQMEKVWKKFSTLGEMKYEGKNDSDSEVKEKSEYFYKSKNFIKDVLTGLEKNLQDTHFNRSKNVDQVNSYRRNVEKEEFTKSHTQDYQRDPMAGDETLRNECLRYLRQENVFEDGKTEMKFFKRRKNRKSSFSKSPNFNRASDRSLMGQMSFGNFVLNCQNILPKREVFDPSGKMGNPSSIRYPHIFQENQLKHQNQHTPVTSFFQPQPTSVSPLVTPFFQNQHTPVSPPVTPFFQPQQTPVSPPVMPFFQPQHTPISPPLTPFFQSQHTPVSPPVMPFFQPRPIQAHSPAVPGAPPLGPERQDNPYAPAEEAIALRSFGETEDEDTNNTNIFKDFDDITKNVKDCHECREGDSNCTKTCESSETLPSHSQKNPVFIFIEEHGKDLRNLGLDGGNENADDYSYYEEVVDEFLTPETSITAQETSNYSRVLKPAEKNIGGKKNIKRENKQEKIQQN